MKPHTYVWLVVACLAAAAATLLLFTSPSLAAEPAAAAPAMLDPSVMRWAYVAACVATCVSSAAAAYAVGRVGSAAVGAIAEKPELFGRVVVLVGLAEGIAIYGLIVSILILNRLG